jgi:ubiquinone/menaquinone biosynthesis C-methylase UbiE
MLPYFDVLLEKLQQEDKTIQQAFGEHVHWGYWDNPKTKAVSPKEFHQAEGLMLRHVVEAAGIKDGCRVLDVGCGLGGTIKFLNEQFSNCKLVGVNIEERQIAVARKAVKAKNGNTIEFIHGDACELPFTGPQFDVILCVESIFHFSDRESFFRGCRRALYPGGRLAVSDFVPVHTAGPVINFLEQRFGLISPVYGQTRLDISVPKYRRIARATGFRLASIQDITAHTLPTYGFLNKIASLQASTEGKKFNRSNSLIKYASKAGVLKYLILSFDNGPAGL